MPDYSPVVRDSDKQFIHAAAVLIKSTHGNYLQLSEEMRQDNNIKNLHLKSIESAILNTYKHGAKSVIGVENDNNIQFSRQRKDKLSTAVSRILRGKIAPKIDQQRSSQDNLQDFTEENIASFLENRVYGTAQYKHVTLQAAAEARNDNSFIRRESLRGNGNSHTSTQNVSVSQ